MAIHSCLVVGFATVRVTNCMIQILKSQVENEILQARLVTGTTPNHSTQVRGRYLLLFQIQNVAACLLPFCIYVPFLDN